MYRFVSACPRHRDEINRNKRTKLRTFLSEVVLKAEASSRVAPEFHDFRRHRNHQTTVTGVEELMVVPLPREP